MDKESKINVLDLFHHIHHTETGHEVHHCGGEHAKIFPKLDYTIKHCKCKKHSINKKKAIGHDLEMNEIVVEFFESCPEGGWHIESGKVIKNNS